MAIRTPASAPAGASALRRELGRWDLTAIGVNQVIGGAVFAVPATLAGYAGGWSPWLVAGIGFASLLIALTFAEVSSRFDATGGPYLYARAAFGGFAGFEVAWMQWITRVASWASVINILATSLGFYWPVLTAGLSRTLLITAIVAAITTINLRGIRQSSLTVNILTVGKLTPLILFVAVGIFHVNASQLAIGGAPSIQSLAEASLLLIFAFGGYENVPVPAGEARDPQRAVPFALVMTIVIVTAVFTLVQVVALGTLPGLAESKTPLADASALFVGGAGAAIITLGAVLSTTGNNMGGAIAGSRTLFAMADQGDLPAWLARVHAVYRTPVSAIYVTSAAAFVLALSGTYAQMAQASAVSRLVVYVAACAATLRLRHARFASEVAPAQFVAPLGPVIPLAAILVSLAILAGASALQLTSGVVALAVGAVLYVITVRSRV